MKTILVLLISSFAYGILSAQTSKVPPEVTNAFKTKYPNAQNVEWKIENNDFLANFTLSGEQKTAVFGSNGGWKEIDTKMSFDSVPGIVKDGFKKSRYADWTVYSVTYIYNSKTIWYKIDIEKSSLLQKRSLYFNSQGILVMDRPL